MATKFVEFGQKLLEVVDVVVVVVVFNLQNYFTCRKYALTLMSAF